MPKKRRSLAVMLAVVLLVALVPGVTVKAAPATYNVVVWVDGRSVRTGDPSMEPYINHDGRTMISVRSVMHALRLKGCIVDWLEASQKVSVECNGTVIEFFFLRQGAGKPLMGIPVAWVNGRAHTLYTAPEINRDRAFLGLRDLGELLEAHVDWFTLDEQASWIAAIDTEKTVVPDEDEYERSARYMEQFTYAVAKGDNLLYEVEIPYGHVFPAHVRPHHVEAYLRGIEESNEMVSVYSMYAYADPPDDGTRLASSSQPIVTAIDYATPKTLGAQRQLALQQFKQASGGRVLATNVPTALRTYYTADGIKVKLIPGGELHYLNKRLTLDVASKFTIKATVGGGLGLAGVGVLARAWPYGSAVAAVAVAGYVAFNTTLYLRITVYCLPASENKGIVMRYRYLRLPETSAKKVDRWFRDNLGFDTGVSRILIVMPMGCEPWTGI